MMRFPIFFLFVVFFIAGNAEYSQAGPFRIIGYFAGPLQRVDSIEVEKLTHLIFCFGDFKEGNFWIRNAEDSIIIERMIGMKKRQPQLKVMLSLGGWGGCQFCSAGFSSAAGRKKFAQSVRAISQHFQTDGIDLDWEYPAIAGVPGYHYEAADREHFTELLKEIRHYNPPPFEISFAAGGFTKYIDSSIDWISVLPYTDFINIMSYDLVHGYSTSSGHHTPLFSTVQQKESTDHAVKSLIGKGVPRDKLIIGAAFYGRYFAIQEGAPVGLYQPGRFDHSFSYRHAKDSIGVQQGFIQYWDATAQAPYAIHLKRRLLATYDNEESVLRKTDYALHEQLGGMMFWQLMDDQCREGLLAVIERRVKQHQKKRLR